jgi:hypothetical protein
MLQDKIAAKSGGNGPNGKGKARAEEYEDFEEDFRAL